MHMFWTELRVVNYMIGIWF